mgnify:CR=1 FL=1
MLHQQCSVTKASAPNGQKLKQYTFQIKTIYLLFLGVCIMRRRVSLMFQIVTLIQMNTL